MLLSNGNRPHDKKVRITMKGEKLIPHGNKQQSFESGLILLSGFFMQIVVNLLVDAFF
jgi:hypothetical protein